LLDRGKNSVFAEESVKAERQAGVDADPPGTTSVNPLAARILNLI